jgi:hypothetical protein
MSEREPLSDEEFLRLRRTHQDRWSDDEAESLFSECDRLRAENTRLEAELTVYKDKAEQRLGESARLREAIEPIVGELEDAGLHSSLVRRVRAALRTDSRGSEELPGITPGDTTGFVADALGKDGGT